MGDLRPSVLKATVEKPKHIPVSETLRANSASGAEFKTAMIELNAPTAPEQEFLNEFAK